MKKTKKLLLLFAVVITALVCFAVSASAKTVPASGKCGDNVYWEYNSTTGELVISGTGPMTDYYWDDSPFYYSYINSVVINNGVTTIGDYAFKYCDSLTEVTIGDSVTTIGGYAFYSCDSLTEVTIPDSVTTIGIFAFGYCDSLTKVTIPDSVTTIGDSAFYNCDSLTEVTIGDSVTTIGDHAFRDCHSLTKVTIPDSVTTIGDHAFRDCHSLTKVTIGDSVTTIGNDAFSGCDSLTEVTIPDSVTTIGNYAFESCYSLTEVTIGDSVTTIGMWAFCLCTSLTEVTIPDSVTTIGIYAFAGDAFGGSSLTKVTIGDSVTTIGDWAFRNCKSLMEVTIGDSVTTIGDKAFEYCFSLTDVYYGGTQEQWNNISIGSYNNYLTGANIHYAGCYHLDENADKFCDICEEYTEKLYKSGKCGDNVTYEWYVDDMVIISGTGPMRDYGWSDSPFFDSNIESVVINDGVTTIGDSAFVRCESLTEVTIGDSVTTIGNYAFDDCYRLTEVTIPDSVITIGDYAFAGESMYRSSLTKVTIGDSVTTIGDGAFARCEGLTEVIIPDSVTTIGDGAFALCDSLTEVTIGDSVTTIGEGAFGSCCSLTKVTIPDSVTTIGENAFHNCGSLMEVTIGDSVTTIGDYAFDDCDSLTEVTIGDSVTTIGDYAFDDCDSLTEVTIPDSVITIGRAAFYSCDSLTKVTIPDSVTTIGDYAFSYCYSLTDVYYSGTKEQWNNINIGLLNSDLTGAKIHYNYCSHTDKTSYPQQNPTCTSIGYTAGVYCPDCEKWVEGHSTIKAKGHSYTEKIIDSKHLKSKATVASPAIYKYDCANCDSISPDKTFTYGKTLGLGVTSSVTATQTTSSVTLTWSKAANATGYRLYYKLPGDINWRDAVTYTTATTKTFSGLPAGQKYTFAVRSAYKKADGSYILGGYKAIETATKASAPTKITAAQNTSAIKLTWNACDGATGYRIYYKSGNTWKVCVSTTSLTTHTFSGLKAGAKYTFAIRPYILADGAVIWSNHTQFMTATKPADVSANVTSPAKGNISLTFGAVNGADGYRVYYKTGNDAYKLYNTYTKAGTLNFSNLKSGTKYTFAVRAGIKTSGGVVWSGYNEAAVTVK